MSPANPPSEYRRRLQHRQTTVIGGILVVMVVLAAVCLAIWTGMLPAPYEPGFSSASDDAAPTVQVCPPDGSVTAEMTAVPVNVYNGTDSVGLAKGVSDALSDSGLTVGTVADWPFGEYDGDVLLTTSEAGLAHAYTLAQVFAGTVAVDIDETQDPTDSTVSVVLGDRYDQGVMSAAEIAQLQAGQPISAPAGCVAPATAVGDESTAPAEG